MPLPRLAFPSPVLENSSAQADPVGVLGWFLLWYFFQHLVGPAQHAGTFPEPGRCPSYRCLILNPILSGSSGRSAVPPAPAAPEHDSGLALPARGTQPLSALEPDTRKRCRKAALNPNPPAARLQCITVCSRCFCRALAQEPFS